MQRISKRTTASLRHHFLKPQRTNRRMSFFPASHFTAFPLANTSSSSSFSPLFRFLDDFEQHNSQSGASPSNQHTTHRHNLSFKTFTPKFDVKETATDYELHGELPGIEQKDVEIEFTDGQTLVIKGRTEKSYTRGTPPSGFVEDKPTAAITEGEQKTKSDGTEGKHVTPHKATVEDEDASGYTSTSTNNAEDQQLVSKKGEEAIQAPAEKAEKIWISERSVGEFSRTFTFPGRVEHDEVKASMKNGVLSIVVPKARKAEGRKITIQ